MQRSDLRAFRLDRASALTKQLEQDKAADINFSEKSGEILSGILKTSTSKYRGQFAASFNQEMRNVKRNELKPSTLFRIGFDVNYKLQVVAAGNGQVKNMIASALTQGKIPFPGDTISVMYFDQALISNTDAHKKGIIGKFTFTGQGYSYDWSICYNSK